jgi:activating signal cointegrator 1
MKAISICQPWATLIVIGAKRFETRSWKTDYRGILAIHASKTKVPHACHSSDAGVQRVILIADPGNIMRGLR